MHKGCAAITAACGLIFLFFAIPSPSATAAEPPGPTSGEDRLFLAFAEDAAVVPNQWWEGRLEYTNDDPVDATTINLVAAFQPIQLLEVGGRVGFGTTDAPHDTGGTGATDADLWGKWHLGSRGETEFSAGALVTLPTGDDTAFLGHDAFDVEAFGAARFRMDRAIIAAHAGIRMNGDGHFGGGTIDGKTSVALGAGAILPLSDQVSLVGELNVESERWQGADSDFRVLVGANWRPFARGMLRGAVVVGLTDGAPDAQLFAGYAYSF